MCNIYKNPFYYVRLFHYQVKNFLDNLINVYIPKKYKHILKNILSNLTKIRLRNNN